MYLPKSRIRIDNTDHHVIPRAFLKRVHDYAFWCIHLTRSSAPTSYVMNFVFFYIQGHGKMDTQCHRESLPGHPMSWKTSGHSMSWKKSLWTLNVMEKVRTFKVMGLSLWIFNGIEKGRTFNTTHPGPVQAEHPRAAVPNRETA